MLHEFPQTLPYARCLRRIRIFGGEGAILLDGGAELDEPSRRLVVDEQLLGAVRVRHDLPGALL